MLLVLLMNLAIAGAEPTAVDLDGDGKVERIVYPKVTQESQGADLEIKIGTATIPYAADYPTTLEPLDLKSGDGRIELRACTAEPRDFTSCVLYRYKAGDLNPVMGEDGKKILAASITATGSGIVLLHYQHRLYTQVEKTTVHRDGTLRVVPQPFYAVNSKIPVDRTFPITFSPGGGAVVANVRPKSEITVLLADGKGNVLLWLSSGITGWASYQTLMEASEYVMSMEMAG
jgi:hypothetical protein